MRYCNIWALSMERCKINIEPFVHYIHGQGRIVYRLDIVICQLLHLTSTLRVDQRRLDHMKYSFLTVRPTVESSSLLSIQERGPNINVYFSLLFPRFLFYCLSTPSAWRSAWYATALQVIRPFRRRQNLTTFYSSTSNQRL